MNVVLMQVVMGNVDSTLQRPQHSTHAEGRPSQKAENSTCSFYQYPRKQNCRSLWRCGESCAFQGPQDSPRTTNTQRGVVLLLLSKKDSLRWRRLCTPCRFCLAVCSSQWLPTTPSTAICQPQLPPCILDCGPGSSNCRPMGQRQPCHVVLPYSHSFAWGSSTARSEKT